MASEISTTPENKFNHAEFVRIFQAAACKADVAKQLGISVKTVTHRASWLRKKGVPLKRFQSPGRQSVLKGDTLQALITLAEAETQDVN